MKRSRFLLASVALLVVGMVLGGVYGAYASDDYEMRQSTYDALYGSGQHDGDTTDVSTVGLVEHNGRVMLLTLIFPLSPLVVLANGFSITATSVGLAGQGHSPVVLAALVVPHGIFEVAAYCIGGAVGLEIPYRAVKYLRGQKDVFDREFVTKTAYMVLLGYGLVVVGSWIEANLTLSIAEALA